MEGEASTTPADEGTPNQRRSSLAGMFPFLQKQQSMDTDQSDRHRHRGGGKVKPGKHVLRSSSGDVMDTMSPPAGDISPSAAWLAAGNESNSTPQHWPSGSPALHTTPTRGLFSKLLSKKQKHRRSASPAGPRSPSLGTSSNGSQSPSSHSADHLPACGVGYPPATPPSQRLQASREDALQDEDAGYGSCYSTPLGSESMQSPTYGGDTLDLRQVMAMRQDMPDVFTPGFNELLQQAGRQLPQREPDTPLGMEDPTVALLTGAQLAQAGHIYDVPSMLLDPVRESNSTPEAVSQSAAASSRLQQQQETPASAEAAFADSSKQQAVHVNEIEVSVGVLPSSEAAQAATPEAVGQSAAASPRLQQQQVTPASADADFADSSKQQAVKFNEIELSVGTVPSSEVAQAAAAAEVSRPCSSTSIASDAASKPVEQQAPSSAAESEAANSIAESASVSSDDAEEIHGAAAQEREHLITPSAASDVEQEATEGAEELPVDVPASEKMLCSPADAAMSSPEMDEQPPTAAEGDTVQPQLLHDLAAALTSVHLQDAADAVTAPAEAASADTTCIEDLTEVVDSDQQPATVEAIAAASEPVVDSATNTAGADAEMSEVSADASVEQESATPAAMQPPHVATVLSVAAVVEHEDEFVLLEQQVAIEAAAEAEAEEFSLLEQQAAAEAAAEAQDDEFAELKRQAAAEAAAEHNIPLAAEISSRSLPEADECSTDNVPAMQITEEPSVPASETSDEAPLPLPAATESYEEPSSPQQLQQAEYKETMTSGNDSPVYAAAAAASAASSARKSARRSPMHLVRESIPLFVSDPSRAMGSPLALEPGDDSLDAQDIQQLSGGTQYKAGGLSGPRLLAHGGAQRVNIGGGTVGGFMSSLEPVAESSFTSAGSPSPIPEGSPSFACSGSGSSSKSDSRCRAAAAGSPGEHSPLHPRQLSSSPRGFDATTPAHQGSGPNLAATPGSVYSTPTLALGTVGGYQQGTTITPQSGVSVGSAIRPTGAVGGALDLSPAMPDNMPGASPTLMLMSGQGIDLTPAHQGGEGNTPSLLDARAASPSAVYATRFMATPFRGALAALPMDAALAAPLVDSSPFSLGDGMDTVCLADEAQRVAQNLAAAAAGGGYSPGPAATPAVQISQAAATPGSASAGRDLDRAGSPTEELRDLHVVMLTKQLAEVQKRVKELEAENERLKEQVEIYEFEKTELNSQEEMEKQARQYAEEQLQNMQVEMQQLMQAKHAQATQMVSMRQEFEGIQLEAQREHAAMKEQHMQLEATITQLQEERNEVLDRLNLLDMQVTALRSNNSELMGVLEAEQQRSAQLEAAMAARDRDIAEAGRVQLEAQNKLERAMEQMIAANTAKEHARQKAADEAAKVQQLMAERQQFMAEREKYQHLKQKYAQKSALAKEMEQRLQAKDAENQELMSMCDQLLQQQEASRRAAG